MYVCELPAGQFFAASTHFPTLVVMLENILRDEKGFTDYAPIEGEPRTGWILSVGHQPHFIRPQRPLTATDAAYWLTTLRHTANYDPPKMQHFERGWEMYQAVLNNRRVAIAWAAWLHPRRT